MPRTGTRYTKNDPHPSTPSVLASDEDEKGLGPPAVSSNKGNPEKKVLAFVGGVRRTSGEGIIVTFVRESGKGVLFT